MPGIISRLIPRSTIGRIALASVGVQVLTTGAALFSMQVVTQHALDEGARSFVVELNQDLEDAYDRGGQGWLAAAIERRIQTVGRRDTVIALVDGKQLIAGNLASWPTADIASGGILRATLRRQEAQAAEPMLVVVTRLPGGERLVAGQTLAEQTRLGERSRSAFVAALLLGALLAAAGSLVLARLIGRRVDHVADVAAEVGGGDLAQRVAISGSGDSFDRLGLAINAMLARIESLVAELRLVTDSLAHDLRSPVARLKSRLEGAVRDVSDPRAQLALGAGVEEADRLEAMLTTALQISRAEAGIGRNQFRTFLASEMIGDLAEVYGPLAEDRGIDIRVHVGEPIRVTAHRELLGQAIANLVDNALNHAEGATVLDLTVARKDEEAVVVTVADNGPGIPEDRRGEALRRFGRLDAARQATGAGLGLSLVATLAHLHRGQLELDDNRPGLIVRLILPIAAD